MPTCEGDRGEVMADSAQQRRLPKAHLPLTCLLHAAYALTSSPTGLRASTSMHHSCSASSELKFDFFARKDPAL